MTASSGKAVGATRAGDQLGITGGEPRTLRLLVFGDTGGAGTQERGGPVEWLPLGRPDVDLRPDDFDYVIVVHVPSSKDEIPRADEVLTWAAEQGKPVVLASPDGTWTPEALHAYNHAEKASPRLLTAGLHGKDLVAAVGAAALRRVGRAEPDTDQGGADYVELGAGFTLPDNEEQYKLLRLQSILDRGNPVTEELCQQFDLAIQYIRETKIPGDGRPPWNPDMSLDAADTVKGGFANGTPPTLKSVYQFHGSREARDLLHPEGDIAGEWRQPPAVLILGETGTGKTELAQHLARESVGSAAPFVKVSGGQVQLKDLIPDFHGLAAGSATTIESAMPGQFAQAAYGVAFLDELGAIPLDVQKALLPFFDDGMIRPRQIQAFKSFLTVIAATDADLHTMIARRQFSPQLRQRFKRMIRIPALHERSQDDRERLVHFAAIDPRNRTDDGTALSVRYIHKDELGRLAEHEYRNGNFRELEAAVHTAIDNAKARGDDRVKPGDVPELELPRYLEALVYRADPPPDGQVRTFVGDKAGFHRIAIDIGTTIQETADGALYLTDRQGLLCWRPDLAGASSGPAVSADAAVPSGLGPLQAVPGPWGRFLVAEEKVGFQLLSEPATERRPPSLGVNLTGDLVAWITPDGHIDTFPPAAADPHQTPVTDGPAECLAVATDGSLVARVGCDLVRYRARSTQTGQLKWDTRKPERLWEGTDATRIARAFLVPAANGDELWWVTTKGKLHPDAVRYFEPVAAAVGAAPLTEVVFLDVLSQGGDLWVVFVLAGEPDLREAVVVALFTSGQFVVAERPLSGSASRVRRSDRLRDVAWVRGRPDDHPMLVLDLDRDRVAVRATTGKKGS